MSGRFAVLWVPGEDSFAAGQRVFRAVAVRIGLALLVAVVAVFLGRQGIDAHLRHVVLKRLNQSLGPSGLRASLSSVRFIGGRGFFLDDLRIYKPAASGREVYVSIEGVIVSTSSGWSDLLAGRVDCGGLTLVRPRATLIRDASGDWNWIAVAQRLAAPSAAEGPPMYPLRIVDGSVEVCEGAATGRAIDLIRGVRIESRMVPGGEGALDDLELAGSIRGSGESELEFRLTLDRRLRAWTVSVDSGRARIDSRMIAWLPETLRPRFDPRTEFGGALEIRGTARGGWSPPSLAMFDVTGVLAEVSVADPKLPHRLRGGHAKFRIRPEGIEVWDASVLAGEGSVQVRYEQTGLLAAEDWRAVGSCRELEVGGRLLAALPESLQRLSRTWSPEGRVDIDFDLASEGGEWRPRLEARLHDAAFAFERFPYRFEHCSGEVVLEGEELRIAVDARDEGYLTKFRGTLQNPGPDFSGFIDIQVEGLVPLDSRLWEALRSFPNTAANIDRFHSAGHVGFRGRIGRESCRVSGLQYEYWVDLSDCAVRHEAFDLPFFQVNGGLRILPDRVEVTDVTGVHGDTHVTCRGDWTQADGLQLEFHARSVSLDDPLRAALPMAARRQWQQWQPRGTVDVVDVRLRQPVGDTEPQVTLVAEMYAAGESRRNTVSVQPVGLPFEISRLSGRMRLGEGALALEGIRGEHGAARVTCAGDGRYDERRWAFRMSELFVSGLRFDEPMLGVLPPGLAEAARRLRVDGVLNVQGEAALSGPVDAAPAAPGEYVAHRGGAARWAQEGLELDWHLRVDVDGGACQIGVPVEHIAGTATFRGNWSGDRLNCTGVCDLDSLMVGESQLVSVRGPIYIDQDQIAVGTLCPAAPGSPPAPITAGLCGGQLRLDGRLQLAEDQAFFLDAALAECDMGQLTSDWVPRSKQLLGVGDAQLRLSGDTRGRHSWRGGGRVQLRDAKIEVPVMSAVGQVVRVSELERTVFDESRIEFEMRGEDIDLTQIELIGSPISLIGNGQLRSNREIDLDFYTILGRNRIQLPLVRDLYHAGSQQFLHIQVDGDLESPRTHKTVLPGINEPLQQLLRDLEDRGVPTAAGLDR